MNPTAAETVVKYFDTWIKAYGYNNGLRRSVLGTTLADQVTQQTRQDSQFIITKLIGDLEVAPGGNRNNVLVNIQINDINEYLFDQPLPFDMVFGSAQQPRDLLRNRVIPPYTTFTVFIYNNTGVTIQYNWMFWGFINYFDTPYDKKALIKKVWEIPRVSIVSWANAIGGIPAFPGSIVPMPAGAPGAPAILSSVSQQSEYPFLVNEIASSGPAIAQEVYYQLTDISGRRDGWFNNPVLARMALGTPQNPFYLDEWRPYSRVEQIQLDLYNYSTTTANVPIALVGWKGNRPEEYNLGNFIVAGLNSNG